MPIFDGLQKLRSSGSSIHSARSTDCGASGRRDITTGFFGRNSHSKKRSDMSSKIPSELAWSKERKTSSTAARTFQVRDPESDHRPVDGDLQVGSSFQYDFGPAGQ